MAVLAERIFNKDSYLYGKRFNYGFMGSVLDMLKAFQYKYKREDVAAIYRFVADVIEHGNFEWAGTFDLKPVVKNDKIETKEADKEVASVSTDTTSQKVNRRSAKPKEDTEASK